VLKQNVLILGGSGQDGAFLAQRYLDLGYQVFSISRHESTRLKMLGVIQYRKDFTSTFDIQDVLKIISPKIIVNLVALSSVSYCQANPDLSEKVNFISVKRIAAEVIKFSDSTSSPIDFVQASSSEMFGKTEEVCDELTTMKPLTIYGKHKLQAHEFILNQSSSNLNFKSIILFNHESEFRQPQFVSYKVSRAAAEVHVLGSTKIEFGNIANERDWGFAGDYMNAMADISIKGKSSSYVVASGKLHSIESMLEIAFKNIGLSNFKNYVSINKEFYREVETPPLKGNAQKCISEINWRPMLSFEALVERLVKYQISVIIERPYA
jgi:GDPmannose 4,6-dehydratase